MPVRHHLAVAVTLALAAPATVLTASSASASAPPPAATAGASPSLRAAAPSAGQHRHLPRPVVGKDATRDHEPHTVLVKFRPSASSTSRDRALKRRGGTVKGAVPGTGFVRVRTTGDAADAARTLRSDPSVASVTLDFVRKASATPNDPAFGYGDQAYLSTVRVPTAWDRSKGSLSTVVAVVDSGVDGQHPDLVGRTVAGFNAVTNTTISAGAASDDLGHGSMVAGIIAATTNNGEGIAGVAWNAKVMPVKVLDSNGEGSDSDVIQGITWAVDHGARIVNLSLGGPGDSPALHDAVKYAVGKGAVVVVAAGNDGDDTDQFPAAYPEAIAVGATDASGRLTEFSSFGSWVDLAAPGFDVLSTGNDGEYWFGSGTSFSAPIVTGAVALVRTQTPSLTPAQVAARLRGTARDAGPRGIDPYFGAGILDVTDALGGGWAAEFPTPAMGSGEPNNVPGAATAMTTSATGTLAVEGDVDWYRFTPATKQTLKLTVAPAAYDEGRAQNADPVIAVYDENLRLVGESDAGAAGTAESLTFVTGSGAYYLSVRNYNGAADSRPYSVSEVFSAPPEFDPAVNIATGSYASTVDTGDVTGDGRRDVLLTTSYYFDATNDYKVFVFPQGSNGVLQPAIRLTPDAGAAPYQALAFDVDRDGHDDVLVPTSAGLQAFLAQEGGTFAPAEVVFGTGSTSGVVVADMDGDGDDDLVAHTEGGLQVLAHEADGSFTASTVASNGGGGELAVGDVDGDSQPDVVTFDSQNATVFHHTDGWPQTTHASGSTWGGNGIEVVDATGDGLDDVVVTASGNRPNAYLSVLAQTPDHTLAPAVLHPVTDIPEPVTSGDVTGDGVPDVIAAHGGFNTLSVLPVTAAGGLGAPRQYALPYASHYSVLGLAVGDVTGDGEADAVVADYNHGLVLLRHSRAAGTPGTTQEWVRTESPLEGVTGLALTATPSVTFERTLDPASVTTSTVRLLHGRTGSVVPATVTWDAVNRRATLHPTAPLQDNTPYRIQVAGVKDASADTMTVPFTSTFRTVDVAPAAAGTFTATGALRAATLTWKAPTPSISDLDRYVVRMTTGTTPPASVTSGTSAYAGTGTSVTLALAQGTTYSFRIWVRDRSGRYSPSATKVLYGTGSTMTSTVTSLKYGGTVTVSGVLTRRDPSAAVAGVPVQLYVRTVGASAWTLLTTRTSSSTGAVSYAHKPAASVDYLWMYRGSATFVGSGSATRRVSVAPTISQAASRTAFALGGTFTLSGSVAPSHAGRTVYLQRYSGGVWSTVTSRALTSTSTYAFTVKPTVRGTNTYRVYLPAHTDHLAGYSSNRSVSVS